MINLNASHTSTIAFPEVAISVWRTHAVRPWLLLAFGLVVLGAGLRIAFLMPRADLFEDDQRQHVFWAYREADSDLFKNDLMADHFASSAMAPAGYAYLYSTLAKWIDAQLAAEIGAMVIMLLAVVLMYHTGKAMTPTNSPLGGVAALLVFFVLTFPKVQVMRAFLPAMLQRSFEPLLTMLTLYGLVKGRLVVIGVAMLMASLVYPIALANIGLSTLIVEAIRLVRTRRMPRGWIWAGLLAVAALGVLAWRDVPKEFGPLVTGAESRDMPIFNLGGRQQMYGVGAMHYYFEQPETGLRVSPAKLFVCFAVLATVVALGGVRNIPFALVGFFVASLLTWMAAHLLLFNLYMPGRHPKVAWFLVFAFAAAAPALWEKIAGVGAGRRFLDFFMRPRVAWSASILLLVIYATGWATIQVRASAPKPANVRELYAFVQSLPKDALLAGYPDDMDNIPLICQRSVLANRETALAYYMDYFREMERRIAGCLAACYASDWSAVDRLQREYGVDVFIVNLERFNPPAVEPWLARVAAPFIEDGQKNGFVLKNPPPERVLYRGGTFLAVRVGPS